MEHKQQQLDKHQLVKILHVGVLLVGFAAFAYKLNTDQNFYKQWREDFNKFMDIGKVLVVAFGGILFFGFVLRGIDGDFNETRIAQTISPGRSRSPEFLANPRSSNKSDRQLQRDETTPRI